MTHRLPEENRGIGAVVREHSGLIALLIGGFLARWLIADRSSYWNDELLSVALYSSWHDSVLSALRDLAHTSIHPPLYQFVLYYWIEIFGDGERATRTLSNLYITLATLFLYLLLRRTFSWRVALAAGLIFTLMYTPMYYALEARSYAQSIFLVVLSSWALWGVITCAAERGWWRALRSVFALTFMAANTALLFTHYYNGFFWAAQGILVGLVVLVSVRPGRWWVGLGLVAVAYGIQAAVFVGLWGQILLNRARIRSTAFEVDEEEGAPNPVELLRVITELNIDFGAVLMIIVLILALVVLIRALRMVISGEKLGPKRTEGLVTLYFFGWLILPVVVAVVAFSIAGVARYEPRYWTFIAPAMATLIVLVIREAVSLAGQCVGHRFGLGVYPGWSAASLAAVILVAILPGTVTAASTEKVGAFREEIRAIVDVVEADQDHSYVVYDAAWREPLISNYYFERFSDEVRAQGPLFSLDQRTGGRSILDLDEDLVDQHDRLIILFSHRPIANFEALEVRLADQHRVLHRQIEPTGRGFIVYEVQ